MATLGFLFMLWLFCRLIKKACKPRGKADYNPDPRYWNSSTKQFYAEIDDMIAKQQSAGTKAIASPAKDVKLECLTEQLLFVEDLISSESSPEKTLKYMKEKQRILTALADL